MPTAKRSRPDPKPGEHQNRAAVIRSLDKEKRTIDVVASTEAVDAHGTVIVQDWNLDRFNANPVILWAHNATLGMDELPVGKALRCEVVNGQLEATIQFAGAEVNPRAEQVWQAYSQEFLRAVSVGFNPGSYRWEEREGREVLVFFDNELLEISCVPIGSNPDALARALAARRGMDDMKITDDRSFIDAMIPHHQAALSMVAAAKGKLEDADLKKLAAGIETTQTAEIAEMERIRDGLDDRSAPRGRPTNPDALARALAARSTPDGRAPAENNSMTEEEKALLALARRALEILGEKEPAAAEARLHGLVEVERAHEKTAPAAEELRAEVASMRRSALIDGAIRDGKLPPRKDLDEGEEHAELRSMLDALSPLAPAKGQRSPLEAYLRTLPKRVPATSGQAETAKGQKAPAGRKAPAAETPKSGEKYRERAKAEKETRRAKGHGGPRVTDAPAEEQEGDE